MGNEADPAVVVLVAGLVQALLRSRCDLVAGGFWGREARADLMHDALQI
jgi:hypothetical protein